MSALGSNMGFNATDWVAIFIFGASALVGTFGKRLVRVFGLAVMPFAFAGLVLSLNHHGSPQGQGPITNNAPSINTNNTKNTNSTLGQGLSLSNSTKERQSRPAALLFEALQRHHFHNAPSSCSAVTARRHGLHSNVCISGRSPILGTVRVKCIGSPQQGQVTNRLVLIVSIHMLCP
jgi:hypothetical protein